MARALKLSHTAHTQSVDRAEDPDCLRVGKIDRPRSIPINKQQAKWLFKGLTRRESEVLYLIIRGYSLTETANKLQLSRSTIVGYFNNLKGRYGLNSKTELIQLAIEMGFIFFTPETLINKMWH